MNMHDADTPDASMPDVSIHNVSIHERGKKLSRIVTGTIGVLAVIAASVVGLHAWADSETTAASTTTSSNGNGSGSVTAYTTPGSGAFGGFTSSVLPGTGQGSHASSNGS